MITAAELTGRVLASCAVGVTVCDDTGSGTAGPNGWLIGLLALIPLALAALVLLAAITTIVAMVRAHRSVVRGTLDHGNHRADEKNSADSAQQHEKAHD